MRQPEDSLTELFKLVWSSAAALWIKNDPHTALELSTQGQEMARRIMKQEGDPK